jgi:hypothetical protein
VGLHDFRGRRRAADPFVVAFSISSFSNNVPTTVNTDVILFATYTEFLYTYSSTMGLRHSLSSPSVLLFA